MSHPRLDHFGPEFITRPASVGLFRGIGTTGGPPLRFERYRLTDLAHEHPRSVCPTLGRPRLSGSVVSGHRARQTTRRGKETKNGLSITIRYRRAGNSIGVDPIGRITCIVLHKHVHARCRRPSKKPGRFKHFSTSVRTTRTRFVIRLSSCPFIKIDTFVTTFALPVEKLYN